MPTTISDLWIPDVWLQTMREKQATFPTLLGSGVVVDNPRAAELASGPSASGPMDEQEIAEGAEEDRTGNS